MSDPALERLAETAAGWGAALDAAALARLETYLRSVRERNRETNLTADDSWDDLVNKHAADGVLAGAVLREIVRGRAAGAPRVLDLGSGAGFIGIALKIAWPQAEVTLMEAVERKFRFLNSAATRVGLPGLRALRRRAGDGAPPSSYAAGFDAVIERALAPLPEAVRLAAPLLAPGGIFAAFQSVPPDADQPELRSALSRARLRSLGSRAYRRPGEAANRALALFASAPGNG